MKNRKSVFIAAALCIVAVAAMALSLWLTKDKASEVSLFEAPAFDAAAQIGVPAPDDKSWSRIYTEGMEFSARVCGNVVVNDGSADVYFTNEKENTVWMKLRVYDTAGNILAETGLIKPGEYVRSIVFDKPPAVNTKIKMKIMAYEPHSYYSAGAVSLNTVIGG